MQSRVGRLALLAAVIIAAGVVFIVLQNNNSDESSDTSQGVQVVQVDKSGKALPVTITCQRLSYIDAERKV